MLENQLLKDQLEQIIRQCDQMEKLITLVLILCYSSGFSSELTIKLLNETVDKETFDLVIKVATKLKGV